MVVFMRAGASSKLRWPGKSKGRYKLTRRWL